MSEITRRTALTILGSASLSALVPHSLVAEAKGAATKCENRNLNVVLHGAFAVEFKENSVTAFAVVDPTNEHQYRAGVNAEELLKRTETYKLTGKCDNKNPEKPERNKPHSIYFPKKNLKPNNDDRVFCTFQMLRPSLIRVLRRVEKTHGNFLLEKPRPPYQPQTLGQILVLTYENANMVLEPGLPMPTSGDGKACNLHLWADACRPAVVEHEKSPFKVAQEMFEGIDIEINPDYKMQTGKHGLGMQDRPPGITKADERHLYEVRPCLLKGRSSLPPNFGHLPRCMSLIVDNS